MSLWIGILASAGAKIPIFSGVVNWLIGANKGKLYASENGTDFGFIDTPVFGTSNVNDVFYGEDLSSPGNKTFLAAADNGILAKSSDGLSWSTINLGTSNNITAVSDYGRASSLSAGSVYTTTALPTTSLRMNSVAYDGNLWVIAGYHTSNRNPQLYRSTNRTTWTSTSSGISSSELFTVAYGNGRWVTAGQFGRASSSTNGISWSSVVTNLGSSHITSIAYGNGLWVGVARFGLLSTSTDSITWTSRTSNFGSTWINCVAHGNDLWIAGGQSGQIRTSTDGVTWTTQNSNFGASSIESVAYGNGLWVAVGGAGQIRTSTDGASWVTQTSNTSGFLMFVGYSNQQWFVGGYSGVVVVSTNATTWRLRSAGSSTVRNAAYGNGVWLIATRTSSLLSTAEIDTFRYMIGSI